MALLRLLLLTFSSVFLQINALECVVCADSSLDEFGECASQFRYDCGQYSRSFPASEIIFCRTTRKRELNNTYTIAKECISEKDHYKTFPSKGYPLEDECDLLEVQGSEIAYCLCRFDRCNQKPIAEQFMTFEEKHPELFGDLEAESKELSEELDKELEERTGTRVEGKSPGKASKPGIAFGAPNLSPIMPVNDPRFQNVLLENSLRRSQPSFEMEKSVDGDKRAVLPGRGADSSLNIHRIGGTAPEELFEDKLPVKTVDTQSPWSSARSLAEEPVEPVAAVVSSGFSPTSSSSSTLRCMQCGEGGLADAATDCLLQSSTKCKQDVNSFCFTRYISVGNGQNAVEKMCVSKEALMGEYGSSFDGFQKGTQCTTASAGRVRVCVCADEDNCNQRTIHEQVASSRTGMTKASAASPLPSPVVPIELPPGVEDKKDQLISSRINSVPNPPLSTSHRVESSHESPPIPPSSEIVPSDLPPPIVPVVVGGPKQNLIPSGQSCVVCTSGDLSDPTADCEKTKTSECLSLEGERTYCLTRQTQLASGLFSIEKKCMTGLEFSDDFPDETAAPGCGTAFEGLVNYCLCRGEMCNKDSLLTQAQSHVPQPSPTTTTTVAPLNLNNGQFKPVAFEMEEAEEPFVVPSPRDRGRPRNEIADAGENLIQPAPVVVEEDEEEKMKKEKQERERKWREETERLKDSVRSIGLSSVLTVLISRLLLL